MRTIILQVFLGQSILGGVSYLKPHISTSEGGAQVWAVSRLPGEGLQCAARSETIHAVLQLFLLSPHDAQEKSMFLESLRGLN